MQGLSNEFGRLTKGNAAGVSWTDTMEFICKIDVSSHKKVTYCSFVCNIRPHKKEKHRVRLVVGGDKLDCDFDTGSPAASMLDTKIYATVSFLMHIKGRNF